MKSKIIRLLTSWSSYIPLIAILLAGGGFLIFNKEDATEDYILLGTVEQGDIVVSISDSGQVSDAEEIELTPNASSKVTGVYVDEGSSVNAGDLLLTLDYDDALFNISEAEINIEQAKQDLEDLLSPAADIDIQKAKNDVSEAKNAIKERELQYQDDYEALGKTIEDYQDQIKDYENQIKDTEKNISDAETTDRQSVLNSAYSTVADIMVDLGDAVDDLDGIITGEFDGDKKLSEYSWATLADESSQREKVDDQFYEATKSYNALFELYTSTSRTDSAAIQDLTNAVYEAVFELSEAYKELDVFLSVISEGINRSYSKLYNELVSDRSTVSTNISKINPHLSNIYDEVEAIEDLDDSIETYQDDIQDYKNEIQDLNESIADSEAGLDELSAKYTLDIEGLQTTLQEKQLDLEDIQTSDATPSDIRAQQLVIKQRENDLKLAQENYEDYFLYAPVSGYISDWDASLGESISSSTVVGTLIDNNKQVVISLNELDILDIELGQTAKITFDAIQDFEAEGVIVKKDVAGTVNSGVVSYEVTLSIQSDDERILTGMSADVDIVLLSKPGVMLVSKVAVKEDREGKYVEVVKNADSLEMQPFYSPDAIETEKAYIEVGDEDDVNYEVISGLESGDRMVLSTISLSNEEEDSSGGFGFPGSGSGPGGGGSERGTPPSF